MIPTLTLLQPATKYIESAIRSINLKDKKSPDRTKCFTRAWEDITEDIFDKMQIPFSASGEIEDIVDYLSIHRRKMTAHAVADGLCIESTKTNCKVYLSNDEEGNMSMSITPGLGTTESRMTYDISIYGPDSVACVITTLFRINSLLEKKFYN